MQIPGIGGDPVGMRLASADPVAEPFEGDVDADLLAIAEAVDDGLGRIEDGRFDLVDHMAFDADRHGLFAKPDGPDRGIADARHPVLAPDGDPYMGWGLKREFMELESR